LLIYSPEDVPQGSEAWLRIRLGTPTTSNFGKIITPTGKPSSQSDDYLNELLGQLLAGKVEDFYKTPAMQRGNDLEPEAVDYYERYYGSATKEVGFVTTRDGRIGCSPDRLVGKDGLLEVKCPMYKQHVKNLRSGEIDNKYYPQVQGQLLLTKRDWCDWMSYHPDMPASIVRIERDDDYLEKLCDYLDHFLTEMDKVIGMLKDRGCPFAIELKPREVGRVEGV
jgi:hypothetical protein